MDILKDVVTIDHKRMMFHLKHSYTKKVPLFVWGTFGIGKSCMVQEFGKQHATELGLKYTSNIFDIGKDKFTVGTLAAHQISAGDIPGLPFPDRENGQTVYLLSELLPREGQGIIFVDELNLAPQLVQSNLYSLIWDRRAGRYELPKGWVVIGAGNTASDRAHIQEFAMPLKNRMGHVQLVVPSVKDWIEDFATPNGIDSRITFFLRYREDYLFKYDSESLDEAYAVPTPRTWELASRLISDVEDVDDVRHLLGSVVGVAIANEFIEYLNLSRNYDIEKIFKQKKVDVPRETSELFALMSAICEYHKKNCVRQSLQDAVFSLIYAFDKEHGSIIMRQVFHDDPKFFEWFKQNDKAKLTKMTKDYQNIF